MGSPTVVIRPLASITEMEEARNVLGWALSLGERDLVPVSLMVAYRRWGIQLGAFVDGRLGGALLAFPSGLPEIFVVPQLGVLAEHRRAGLGRGLAEAVCERARQRGLRYLKWTSDALDPAALRLYHDHLGAIGYACGLECYGALTSAAVAGLPSHRLHCLLDLHARLAPPRGPDDRHFPASASSVALRGAADRGARSTAFYVALAAALADERCVAGTDEAPEGGLSLRLALVPSRVRVLVDRLIDEG